MPRLTGEFRQLRRSIPDLGPSFSNPKVAAHLMEWECIVGAQTRDGKQGEATRTPTPSQPSHLQRPTSRSRR